MKDSFVTASAWSMPTESMASRAISTVSSVCCGFCSSVRLMPVNGSWICASMISMLSSVLMCCLVVFLHRAFVAAAVRRQPLNDDDDGQWPEQHRAQCNRILELRGIPEKVIGEQRND